MKGVKMKNQMKQNSNEANSIGSLQEGALQKIKTSLREWYGNLSIKELSCNKELTAQIEKLERLLAGHVVTT